MRTFTPFGNRVVLQQAEAITKTESGIQLTGGAVERPAEATVLSVGPDVRVVQPGDVVAYPRFAGTEVEVDGTSVLVLDAGELIGKLSPALETEIIRSEPYSPPTLSLLPNGDQPGVTMPDGSPIPVGSKRLSAGRGWEVRTAERWEPMPQPVG